MVLPPAGNVTSCDIRGSSPSSRELALLHPDRKLTEVSAILLTGGSAFGLAAADGVVSWLAEQGIGYATGLRPVPIVPAAVIFDLGVGHAAAHPGPNEGRAACEAAADSTLTGAIGAGTGASVGKWAGREFAVPGGLGVATAQAGEHTLSALAVVNAVGDIVAADGSVVAGTRAENPAYDPPLPPDHTPPAGTVLVVIATSAALDKQQARWVAARGSDGITVSVRPAHTRYDGDVVFATAARMGTATSYDLDLLGYAASRVVADAVRSGVLAT